jgi:hypothetical protein
LLTRGRWCGRWCGRTGLIDLVGKRDSSGDLWHSTIWSTGPSRRWRFFTITGADDPSLSRGTSI